jgi:hypothetical protein
LTKKFFIIYVEPMNELTVILKDSERTYRQKFLIYKTYSICPDDPVIFTCIEQAKKNFEGDPESVQVKIHMEIE